MMETGVTSRFALLLDALQRAGKYTFAAELKRNFVPDSLWGASSAAPAGLGGHATHENEKVVAVDVVDVVVLVDVVVEVVV